MARSPVCSRSTFEPPDDSPVFIGQMRYRPNAALAPAVVDTVAFGEYIRFARRARAAALFAQSPNEGGPCHEIFRPALFCPCSRPPRICPKSYAGNLVR